ncbi:no significant blast hit [Histoplasma capsulatum G186AR]|uniref:Uncharacterized protein n=1 Tax=Ajellomyces capsulatus TaxID=5037 RepID=A0A8H7Z4N9_AJECA|nr:hypothetical protein I7I52_01956 [Histoplasma capsulatum]QSS69430.1 no significant blast hit [Histoplasma capsulatum G186AR]
MGEMKTLGIAKLSTPKRDPIATRLTSTFYTLSHRVSYYTVIPTPSRALTLPEEKCQREPTRKNTPCEARDGISKVSEALVLSSTAGRISGD